MILNKLKIEKTKNSKINQTNFKNLEFGKTFSDHMLLVTYKNNQWQAPEILPFQNLSMSPASAVLHYGQSIFEGMKAYRGHNNEILVFRPEAHYHRMNVIL